jgi:putative membrane protein
MILVARILTGLIAAEHIYILYMEMFAWETLGKRTFKGALDDKLFKPTRVLAANQGLYNGFLSAGLIWTFFIADTNWKFNISIFFLACVIIAGIYGALTAHKKIFFTQALPALIALIFVLFTK